MSPADQVLGRCVVRELNEVETASLGPVFADVSVIQLDDNVVVDNSLHVTDSNDNQQTCAYVHWH